jgi:lipoyl(octanoyl) transferase
MEETKRVWKLMWSGSNHGSWNMAADERLLEIAAEHRTPILRFFTWTPPTLSLGYAQKIDRHINLSHCRAKGIPVVRRVTGGKAVLHDRELTYSISGGAGEFPFQGSILDSYKMIAHAFLAAFGSLGISAEMAAHRTMGPGGGISSCFAQPSAYEIVVKDRKILGSAQKRTQSGILQHGSLLLDYRHDDWMYLLKRHGDESAQRVTTLRREMGRIPVVSSVIEAIKWGFSSVYGVMFEPFEFSREDRSRIDEFTACKYRDLSA